jgi:hypothetical protein
MTDEGFDGGPPRGERPRDIRPDGVPAAWRLTYEYDADGVRLSAQQRVATMAPPDDSELTHAARAGYWVELRAADGHGLYRQILVDPFRTTVEAHSSDPAVGSTHVTRSDPAGVFQVVVPDLPDADEVVLHGMEEPWSSAGDVAARSATARPLLTVRLHETPPFEVG